MADDADDADDTTGSRPSLEAPKLFGRKRATSPVDPSEPTGDDRVFEDSGLDVTRALPVTEDDATGRVDETADTSSTDPTSATAGTRRVRRQRRTRRSASSAQGLDDGSTVAHTDEVGDHEGAEEAPARRRRPRPTVPALPRLSGRVAAAAAGLVVGLSLLGLTWLGFRGCEALRGTNSCGTAPGMAALVVIFVLAVVVGGVLLSLWGVPDPGASSFLGTGLTGVIILIFLVDHLESWPALVAIPLITAGTFLASWWVTTTYVEPA